MSSTPCVSAGAAVAGSTVFSTVMALPTTRGPRSVPARACRRRRALRGCSCPMIGPGTDRTAGQRTGDAAPPAIRPGRRLLRRADPRRDRTETDSSRPARPCDVPRPVTLVRVSLLRRSSSPTGSSTGKTAEAAAAQSTAESVRVAGGTAARAGRRPKRREAEGRRRGPAPAPPKTQREAASSRRRTGLPRSSSGSSVVARRSSGAPGWRGATTSTSRPATAARCGPTSATSSTRGRTSSGCSCRWRWWWSRRCSCRCPPCSST